MHDHYNDFKKYRTKLRLKYFYNDRYKRYHDFYKHIKNLHPWNDLWDTTIFSYLSKNLNNISSIDFLNKEIINPTLNWTDLFDYNNALQKHPYFKEYIDSHIHDASFWERLNKYKNRLSRQIPNNNQQLWI